MFAILALVLFLLCAFGLGSIGPVSLLALGLAALAAHLVFPLTPWTRSRP
jgi:hypothetical protein